MFEFVCEHIVPGCSFTERGETAEKLLEQSMDHLRDHHNMEYVDKSLEERMKSVAIVPVK